MPDDELKILMNKLGQAINETLTESPKVNVSIQNIKDAGYEVFLTIEAAAVGTKKPKSKTASESLVALDKKVKLRLTPDDAKFLKQLKISVDDYSME
ncbi:MAG: hypothetical protein HYR55_19500 [Acidobacteria bacterium]|nr:hypothetical protein [Acidobacteriota bacterium]MBI3655919.1 hypothetical protein [Acidobacteriota bacterium]